MSDKHNYASAQFLTYKHPAYNGCTFDEVVMMAGIALGADLALNLVVNLMLRNVYCVLPIFLVASVVCFLVFKKITYRIGDFKQDKPHGYVMKNVKKQIHRLFGHKLVYVTHCGKWSTRRSVK